MSDVLECSSHTDHYMDTPGARKNGPLALYENFEQELDARADSIASMLPSTVTPARFRNTVIAAVRQDPMILNATPRSLMSAILRAAQDGLVPDGREGHIAVYNVNVAKKNEAAKWERHAQWNPMAFGLRKRLRELDNIIANAEVVHEKDHFVWHQGDDPRIEHEPAKLGTSRGSMIGAYCIYKREDGAILHREVMDREQVEATREQSKAKDSLMWTKFVSEGYRKSVLRRGIKTVPVSDAMREIVQRDDEATFAFTERREQLVPPPAPKIIPPSSPKMGKPATPALPGDWQDYLERQRDEYIANADASMKQSVCEAVTDAITGAQERGELSAEQSEEISEAWNEMCEKADS